MNYFESAYSSILDYWSCGKHTASYPIDDDLQATDSDSLAISPRSSGSTCTSEKRGSCISFNSICDVKKQTPLLSKETPPFYDSDGAFVSNIKSGNKFLKLDEERFSFKLTDPRR
jgi:hypothetical protein